MSTAFWFYELDYLEHIKGMEDLDTSNVTDMDYMFYGCSGLSSLDVSSVWRCEICSIARAEEVVTS